ncbi:c-type cytochrome [Paenibacillus glycanilyticus]|uniref:Cytochrome c-551 n=1 Tax=Paenibacillus glycanilyticus TaxID=126569 RepID=A0ABQ6G921_9BACL|nr:cytochrome c [Paenibacillus glycanilyticus]GLX66182.1 cytochrome c-551 [Paenibacillus glycanilyticus]
MFAKNLFAAMLIALLLAACGNNGSSGSQISTSHMDAPEKTGAVYKANCVSCHGSDLQGRMGDQTNLQKVGARMTEPEIAEQIKHGGSSMPPFEDRLTDEQIASLAAWLASKQ